MCGDSHDINLVRKHDRSDVHVHVVVNYSNYETMQNIDDIETDYRKALLSIQYAMNTWPLINSASLSFN